MPALPTTAELLEELSTFDEFSCWSPGTLDHHGQRVPEGTEVVLQAQRFSSRGRGNILNSPLNVQMPMTRHDGELIIEALHRELHPRSGGDIPDVLWLELDEVVDRIQARIAKGKAPKNSDKGQALGLAMAIAIMRNPYAYDIESVRVEAMERWDARTV
jgi:hypothetical protein